MSDKKTRPKLTLDLKDKVLAHLLSIEDPEPSEVEITRADMVMELKDAIQNLLDRKFTMKQISQALARKQDFQFLRVRSEHI